MAERWEDPVSYGPAKDARPETFEPPVDDEIEPGEVARVVASLGAVLLLLWLPGSMAVWAFGESPKVILSGIVAGFLGLFILAWALPDSKKTT